MNTLTDFKTSLNSDKPAESLPAHLKSLWYDAKGDWDKAHAQVDHLSDNSSSWVHAYLHRKEGDTWNADYWYSKAGKIRPDLSLQEEWENLVSYFLQ
ncbi:hypothetical protein DYU05_01050 [Mucilaginibacter terrenus]|uniref:Uncharacterized protein n=1 Tax=Mucilaginibacter terrenus TaxID=2482727 RepID=A0A3E2NTB7_9SPHI|nr:hypothetical protein [Mucilaginibacter terrenus]RFZ84248.1 hypothetical protein DYU05_01050 [Mucilaginibacter terrenus]